MPDPTITAPPTAPSRADAPDLFVSRADAFLGWFAPFRDELVAFVAWVNAQIVVIGALVDDATAAINALVSSAGFTGTSTSSVLIETGSKTFTTQTGRAFSPGTFVVVAVTASPSVNFVFGQVTAYNSGTGALTVDVSSVGGSGTFSAWTISLSAPRGATGATFTGGTLSSRLNMVGFSEARGTYTTGAMDTATGSVFDAAISSNVTVSLTNLPASPVAGQTVTAVLRATITGSPVITWPGSTQWLGGVAPTISAGLMIVTISALWTGSAWSYSATSGKFS